ncbi:MAG: glutathione S-transferase family protein [Gammaproteobacteria bacterium]|nr:glutathione S-transferase family protein [Gammaproteobacteria bacterium]MCY4209885.1 glutathione S-transferase family protein [Gammaproteobacteria bacterium]MCY4338891.1 glutathione S-transferase family protein [Gammaproteobacteria bacterium]
MLELYTHPMSPCSQKVRIVLAEKTLDWDKRHVNLAEKENLAPEYLKLNPLGVVPTLVDDGKSIIESSIICEYLEDRNPEPRLRPDHPYHTAQMRFWMKHVDNKVHPACGALQWPLVMADKIKLLAPAEMDALIDRVVEKPRRERQRRLLKMGYDAPDIVEAVATYEQTIADMERLLEAQDWLAGTRFSLADAAMAPYFQTLRQFGWSAWYLTRTKVTDWYERCVQRASYQTGVAADFPVQKLAELKDRGAAPWRKIQEHLGR